MLKQVNVLIYHKKNAKITCIQNLIYTTQHVNIILKFLIAQVSILINYTIQYIFQIKIINYVPIVHKKEIKLKIIHVFNLNHHQIIYLVVLLLVLLLV